MPQGDRGKTGRKEAGCDIRSVESAWPVQHPRGEGATSYHPRNRCHPRSWRGTALEPGPWFATGSARLHLGRSNGPSVQPFRRGGLAEWFTAEETRRRGSSARGGPSKLALRPVGSSSAQGPTTEH